MPLGDRTGPEGQGAMTGRLGGNCPEIFGYDSLVDRLTENLLLKRILVEPEFEDEESMSERDFIELERDLLIRDLMLDIAGRGLGRGRPGRGIGRRYYPRYRSAWW